MNKREFKCFMSSQALNNNDEGHDYSIVTERINYNLEDINKLLSKVEIQSKIAPQEVQISNFLNLNIDNLIVSQPCSEYYELDQVKRMFDMLHPSKPKKMLRTESVVSLTSSASSCSCIDNIGISNEGSNEITSCITEILETLKKIKNSSIEMVKVAEIQERQKSKNVKIVDLSMKFKKLYRELQSIASADQVIPFLDFPKVDDSFIKKLIQVNQSLSEVTHCCKDLFTEQPKMDNCSFQLTSIIDSILEAVEKCPLSS